jgi:hypothetical protein
MNGDLAQMADALVFSARLSLRVRISLLNINIDCQIVEGDHSHQN